jgi:hypothetical protein
MMDEVNSWLIRGDRPVLFIFDNADDQSINLGDFIPHADQGRIIITTRNEAHRIHAHPSECQSRVGELQRDEAVSLLHRLVPADKRNHLDAQRISERIVHELGYLALAITHAGSHISASTSLIHRTYPEILDTKRQELLSQRPNQTQDRYKLAVYITWELSFGNLKANPRDQVSAAAAEFFQICSFLDPKSISTAIFKRAFKRSSSSSPASGFLRSLSGSTDRWDDHTFSAIINRLSSYSFITAVTESQYTVHPLVHKWGKDRLPSASITLYAGMVFQILADSISWGNSAEEISERRMLVPHLVHAGASLMLSAGGTPARCAAFSHILREAGHYTVSEELEAGVLDQRIEKHGKDHPSSIIGLANLGITYQHQGKWSDAERIQKEVIQKSIDILGKDHISTLRAMNNLAWTYTKQNRLVESVAIQAEVMQRRVEKLGENHSEVLRGMSMLAMTYQHQSRWSDAELLQVKVVERRAETLGEDHADTLTAMNNLAWTYTNQRRWVKAEEIQKTVMQQRIEKFGEGHPETLKAMNMLGLTYKYQCRWTDAEAIQKRVVELRTNEQGKDHPETLKSMDILASTYRGQRRWRDAEVILLEVVKRGVKKLGKNHPDARMYERNLASVQRSRANA